MTKFKIKKGDMIKVIAGDDKGKTGKVIAVLPKTSQVIVEGCKIAKKTLKPTENEPKGGFISKEMPMSISNVKKAEEK
ncbi:50S ribosomal protein L24 [Helicobacter sp. 13S00482-2]|uniref:50S ribosomal protein L24 n=1 Tax=Helicobacter sp. 13S00482-2 TaxID=1476200 RepID=UPI000BA68EBD|nr:50S ribosomal protein L24 [Helicobacter sp. 13S00482-2]PAF54304.1 50S ribosomal protein L24 [Helicobacter sp. 13S00482-2]